MSNKYDSYKDSGIEWIGEIPSHWDVSKVKFIFEIQKGKTPKNLLDKIGENSQVYLAMDYLRGEPKQTFYVSSDESVIFTDEDETLLLWDGSNAGEFIKSKKGVLSSTMALIKSHKIDKKFQWFFFKSFESLLKDSCNGMGIPHVDGKFFRSSEFIVPSQDEQTTIANYLDQKTTQIDDLIAKKQQLIHLLEEERTAIINQAVTKGLDPNVPMKDSGIEWLGEIPEHWDLKRMRYLCDITTGGKDTENKEDDGLYPFYVRSQTVERISSYSFEGEAILTAGDGVGVCKVWHYVNEKFDFHQRVYMICNFHQVLGKYLFYYLKENFGKEVMKLSAKSTVDSLRRPMFQNFLVCFGSVDEQNQIVLKIEKEENRIQSIIEKTNQEIELLKEYKTALISEVVTGKVDVRNEKLN